ncbi:MULTISPECIES: DeoR/GlpR family DNA-binding transcription regulator [unclassified Microbacterium]|uniref:DeoR/GlpR family DNA-binding transcription regulator n=1 Tax=unclassified Microbacterium TaxID=2609290 RepID=UPI00097EE5D6|nr:DeoR/GlpR family DNA-binding transcription regulator [Microbacterium sp. JB110]RCS60120.1 DeoR/GlpR transcriptional regulator [Microbacterium sp. JB110]SJM47467.1 Glycerol-3-phosphate regulon repressor GlpR [Frigoribacterium sp. JB110]
MSIAQAAAPHATSRRRADRMARILGYVNERGSARLTEIAEALAVSTATMRRDLTDMDEQGLLIRSHGGARALDPATEVPVQLRDSRFREAKLRIAEHAAGLLPDGQYSVAISGGTTAAAVARALTVRDDLSVATNALTTATELASRSRLTVIMTGGFIRSSSLEAVGVLAEKTFSAINVGTAFLGTDGISARGGATTHNETEARTNHAMVTQADRVVVVADGSKIGRATLAKVAELSEVDVLVTDSSADQRELDAIAAAGVDVQVVADASED